MSSNKVHAVQVGDRSPITLTDHSTGSVRNFEADVDGVVMATRADADRLLAAVPGATYVEQTDPEDETPDDTPDDTPPTPPASTTGRGRK